EGVTYYVTPTEIRDKYKELADLLGKQLKTTVKVVPVDQYPVLRKGLDEQQYELAFVHPAHHSLMSIRDGKYRLVVLTKGYRSEGVTYYVTPTEIRDKYKELADLLGKQLKTTVKVVPVDQYPVLRKGLDEQQYELAFVHPAHHSLMSIRDGKYRLVVLTKGY